MEEKELLKIQKQSVAKSTDTDKAIDPVTGQTFLFDPFIDEEENIIAHGQRILPRINSEVYQEVFYSLLNGKKPTPIFICKKGKTYAVTPTYKNLPELGHRNKQNAIAFFDLCMSGVITNCYDWKNEKITRQEITIPYSAFINYNIIKNTNQRVRTLNHYYLSLLQPLVLTVVNEEKNKPVLTNISLFTEANFNDNYVTLKIAQNAKAWSFFVRSYVGTLFVWRFYLTQIKAFAIVHYSEYLLRVNHGKPTTINYDTLFYKVLELPKTQKGYTYNGIKYTPKGTTTYCDFLKLLIEHINKTQNEHCPITEDEADDPRYLIITNNEKARQIIIEAGTRPQRIYKRIDELQQKQIEKALQKSLTIKKAIAKKHQKK